MTSATTQLVLSGPPEPLARAMSSRVARSGSPVSVSTRRISSMRHDGRQAVGAEQVAVSLPGVVEAYVGGAVGSSAQGSYQQRPLGVGGGLFRAETSFVDHRLHHGVVLRDLEQLPVAQEVDAGVADVDEGQL